MNQPIKSLKILQWNVLSFNKRKPNLLNFLSQNKFDILVLSETWQRSSEIRIRGFTAVQVNRPDGRGGVAILISNEIYYKRIDIKKNFNDAIEACAVYLEQYKLSVVSIYKTPKKEVTTGDWDNLFSQFSTDTILCGDFNCHHTLWGSTQNFNNGNRLVSALNNKNLIVVNDGNPTRVTKPGERQTAIDLTITSPNLTSRIKWSIYPDPMGSDHHPIIINFGSDFQPETIYPSNRWNENSADWILFQTLLDSFLSQYNNSPESISFSSFMNFIHDAANQSMKTKKPFSLSTPKPLWWDLECSLMVGKRKEAYNKYKKISNLQNYINLKNINAKTKLLFKTKSKASWKTFLDNLNKNTQPSKIWFFIKKISNKNFNNPKSPIPLEMIDKLLKHFAPDTVNNIPQILQQQDNETFKRCFTFTELECALNINRKSAPGNDMVSYNILKHFPHNAKLKLLEFYNVWWEKSEIPEQLKEIVITLIRKPNHDPNLTSSYRPISLMSCLTKTYERMIKTRLDWYLEYYSKLPPTQYGFRRGKGTLDAVSQLVTDIQCSFTNNSYLACLFVDIKGAYDSVDLNILTEKMLSLNIGTRASASILQLFQNRKIFIRDQNNKIHGARWISQGIPQGAVLSPILFNIYTHDIHKLLGETFKSIQYADDFCFYTVQSSFSSCITEMKYAFYCLKNWFLAHNLEISAEKSAIVTFTRRRLTIPSNICLCGVNVPIKRNYKYLGIVLDNKLLWNDHIEHIKNKCEKGINMLKCVTRTKWGADPNIALQFYKAYIRSILDYGSFLYGSAANCHLRAVDRVQYSALRISIGAMKSSPIQTLLVESQEPPLHIRRIYLASKEIIKLKCFSTDSPLLNSIHLLAIDNLTNRYWELKRTPLLADAYVEEKTNPTSSQNKLPIYSLNLDTIMFKPKVYFPEYNELPSFNRKIFQSIVSRFNKYKQIYTDGSKSKNGTGMAFYIPSTQYQFSGKLPNHCSVYSAETLAIEYALKWVLQTKEFQNVVLISDSKSVLMALNNLNFLKIDKSEHLCNIKMYLNKLLSLKINVTFLWVKGHCGIEGNEIVDSLAKQATQSPNFINVKFFSDLVIKAKNEIRTKWGDQWKEFINKSNNHYTQIHPTLPTSIPHLSNFNVSRKYAVTITRLKINHGRFPTHLNKLHLADSPYCSCDGSSLGDLNHIFFSCRAHQLYINQLLQTLIRYSIPLPTNITILLSTQNKNIFDALTQFLNNISMDI